MSGLEEGLISGLLVTSIGIGIAAYVNGEKLRKRINYMQKVLIKKGLVGEYELTLALRGIKIHDEDDED
jgi:hypothetical protein